MATVQTFVRGNRPRIVYDTFYSTVFAYPSAGGFVRKEITAAELDWLGLRAEPSNDTSDESIPILAEKMYASDSINKEDAFALRLMQLGGRWWPNQKLYDRHPIRGLPLPYGHHFPRDLDIGYSLEGVYVLQSRPAHSKYDDGLPGVASEKPETWSRLLLCVTMEERYKVLRAFGAVMYSSVEECPDLPDSLEEGIAQGQHYAELLRKMEDPRYQSEWVTSLPPLQPNEYFEQVM